MNKIVLITGASGGLGSYVTQAFLDAGARVAGVSRKIDPSDFPHPAFTAMPAELSSAEAVDALVAGAVAKLGRLDAVVHLMGAFAGGKPVTGTDDQTLEKMLTLNYRSAFYLFRSAARRMGEGGRLVAIGSRNALEPMAGSAAYSASKAALISLVQSMAVEVSAQGITANVIVPDTMDTPANRSAMPDADFTKWVDPQGVASLAVWLVSDAGGQVNGAAIPVYGRAV